MNTKGLARHYETLTPWERVPLILAASQRGDNAERERLARAAPVNTFTIPNHFGLSEGLRLLAAGVRLHQLDLAAAFWRTETVLADGLARPCEAGDAAQIARLQDTQKMLAYSFRVYSDAWSQLCAELHLPVDFLEPHLPGTEMVAELRAMAHPMAFTIEEAVAYPRHRHEAEAPTETDIPKPREYRIDTVADIVATWRGYLQEHLCDWA